MFYDTHTQPDGFMRVPINMTLVVLYAKVLQGIRLCEFSGCRNLAVRLVTGRWWLCNSHDWEANR